MSTTTDTTPTDTTQALPATIELSTETLVDVVAHLYALENVLGYLNAGQDTPTSRAQGRLADRLLLEPCGGRREPGPLAPAPGGVVGDAVPLGDRVQVVERFLECHLLDGSAGGGWRSVDHVPIVV